MARPKGKKKAPATRPAQRSAEREPPILPDTDKVAGFITWVTAALSFMAALTILAGLALSSATQDWTRSLSGVLTIEIPVTAEGNLEAQTRQVAELLRSTAGVAQVRILPDKEVMALLEPWIGTTGLEGGLPVPRLIDVRLDRDYSADLGYIETRIHDIAPEAVLDDHDLWLARIKRLAQGVELVAFGVVMVILALVVVIIAFAARSSLVSHRSIIELLHLIGAQDSFIAGHFQRQAFKRVLKGGLFGLILAGLSYLLIAWLFEPVKSAMIGSLGLSLQQIAVLVLLPPLLALVAALASRITVIRQLRKML